MEINQVLFVISLIILCGAIFLLVYTKRKNNNFTKQSVTVYDAIVEKIDPDKDFFYFRNNKNLKETFLAKFNFSNFEYLDLKNGDHVHVSVYRNMVLNIKKVRQ